MKEKVKRAGILMFVFLIAVIVFSFLTNQGNADMTADMGGATLPRIQIVSGEYEINPLAGYVSEMNVGKMRSTITPVDFQSGIKMCIRDRNYTHIKMICPLWAVVPFNCIIEQLEIDFLEGGE